MDSVNDILLGIKTPHTKDYESFRPAGRAFYLVACFDTPFSCLTKQGWQEGNPGDCMIIRPDFTEHHRGTEFMEEGFMNDWIHVYGLNIGKMLDKYDCPANTIIPTRTPGLIRSELLSIQKELFEKQKFYEERIELLMETIILKMARTVNSARQVMRYSSQEKQYFPMFLKMRQKMYEEYAKQWPIKELADSVGLSESRFSVLYQKFFNISPHEDLINCRIDVAKKQLISTADKMSQIAEDCGFSNMYYFSKKFYQNVGVRPSEYRKGTFVS